MRFPTVILLLGVAVFATVHGDYIGDFYGEAHRAALHDAVDLIADNKDAIKDSINGLATPTNEAADDLAALKLLDAISEVESSLPDKKMRGLKNSVFGLLNRGKKWLKKKLIKGMDGIFKKKCKGKRCNKNKDKKKRPGKGRGQGGKRGQGGGRGNGGGRGKGNGRGQGDRNPKKEKAPVPIPAPAEPIEEPIEQPAPEPAPGTDDVGGTEDVGAEEPATGSEDYAAEELAPGEQEAVAEQARLANRARNIYRRLKCAIRRGRSKPAWCQEYLRPPLSFDDQYRS